MLNSDKRHLGTTSGVISEDQNEIPAHEDELVKL
jgi:hypothetical protein